MVPYTCSRVLQPVGLVHADPLREIAQQHPAVSIGSYPADDALPAGDRPKHKVLSGAWSLEFLGHRKLLTGCSDQLRHSTLCASALVVMVCDFALQHDHASLLKGIDLSNAAYASQALHAIWTL